MELKRIDNLWHFFATQNQLFLKKEVGATITYCLKKNKISACHSFNPKSARHSALTLYPDGFGMAVDYYTAGHKKFGLKTPALKVHQQLFFPSELLKLNACFNVYVERDRFKNLKVRLEPFHPKKIQEVLKPANLISETLWGFKFFSEIIKN
jgi:hypothetical protein